MPQFLCYNGFGMETQEKKWGQKTEMTDLGKKA